MSLPPRAKYLAPASLGSVCLTLLTGTFLALITLSLPETSSAQGGPVGPASPASSRENRAKAEFFEARVRPLLAEKCQPCHNAALPQGNVRLDTREQVLKTLVPGKPASSKLIGVVHYTGRIKMPPLGKLSASEIATLEKWVADGAYWPANSPPSAASTPVSGQHWALRPVRRPLEPPVDGSGIDAFIQGELEQKGLTLSPRADRRTLLRRLSFDLTGLPPTLEEIRAFAADTRPDAYARQVDRLLASPRFGERWARHWLDLARYADSNGLDENLAHGNAYLYRDWVIEAHNRDLPYDRFIRQQIAGDLMTPTDPANEDEEERNRRIIATGYLTLGAKVLAEQDKPKLVMDIVDEQIEVVSKSVMGLTIACARCHDHKFDPVSTRDYYALAGIFKSTRTMANLDFVSRWNERPLQSKAREAEIAKYRKEVLEPLEARRNAAVETARQRLSDRLRQEAPTYARVAYDYLRQPGVRKPLVGREVPGKQVIEAESFTRGNVRKNFDTYGKGIGVIHTGDAPTHVEWEVNVEAAGTYQLDLRYSAEEARPVRLLVNGKSEREIAGGVTGSWNPDTQQWEIVGAFPLKAGTNILRLERDGPFPHIDKLALAPSSPDSGTARGLTDFARDYKLQEPVLKKVVALIDASQGEAAAREKLLKEGVPLPEKPETLYSPEDSTAVQEAEKQLTAARENAPRTLAAMAVEEQPRPENVAVHIRGDTQNLGEMVPRGFPRTLCGGKNDRVPENAGSGRLELANWLTSPEHPLTARVAVNRVWLHLFGEGLVRTPDNWGLRGEKPTHPELLDYLAHSFIHRERWSLKKLIRRIVLSETYRQRSDFQNPKAERLDPDNRLLWRQNLRRLEAEPLRDALHYVAGTLDLTMGGTLLGTKNGDYVTNDQSANAAQYNAPRRAIYLPVIRNAVYDFFATFDFGDPSMVNAQRASPTVAPQALFLLNSPLVREQARALARRALQGEGETTDRIRQVMARIFSRSATPAEINRAQKFLARGEALLALQEKDRAKRQEAVWAAYCQTLLASNEFIYLR